MGLDCSYISDRKSYEQLYLDEVQKDFNCNETEYLKNGVIQIFECLKVIENEVPLTEDGELKLFWKEHIGKFEEYRKYQNFNQKQENDLIFEIQKNKTKTENQIFLNSISALSRELAEFKVRLNRIGINSVVINDEVEFIEVDNNETKIIESIEKHKFKNPHSDIFTDGDSFALFEHLHSVFYDKDSKEIFADFSMIYRQMYSDGLILDGVRPTHYIKWIQKHYDISLGTSLKKTENPLKIRFYEKIKNLR
jgi:hypothetical protein